MGCLHSTLEAPADAQTAASKMGAAPTQAVRTLNTEVSDKPVYESPSLPLLPSQPCSPSASPEHDLKPSTSADLAAQPATPSRSPPAPITNDQFQASPLYQGPLPSSAPAGLPTSPTSPPSAAVSFSKRRLAPSRNSSRSSMLSRELNPPDHPAEPDIEKERDSGGVLEAGPSCASVTMRTSSQGVLGERTSRLSSGSLIKSKFARGDSLTCMPNGESKRRASLTLSCNDPGAIGKQLLKAARAGMVDIIQAMLDLSSSQDELINYADPEYDTALHKAAMGGHAHMVAFLMEHAASPLAQNKDGYTPIMVAAEAGHRQVCILLATNGGAAKTLPPRVLYTIGNAHTDRITCIELSRDGRRMLTASSDETVRLWQAADAQQIALVGKHKAAVSSCAFMQHAPGAVSCCADNTVTLWDLYNVCPEEVAAQLPGGRPRIPLPVSLSIMGHADSVLGLGLSPSGGLLTASMDGSVKCWDISRPPQSRSDIKLVYNLTGHGGPVRAVAVSADGQLAVTGSDDKLVRLWDLRVGSCAHVMPGHAAPISCCGFAPNGRRVLSGSEDGVLIVWDVRSGLPRFTLSGHTQAVTKVVVSADSTVAYSVSLDTQICVWDITTGQELVAIRGHRLPLTALGVSADGQMLVMGSEHILKAVQLQPLPGLQPWQSPQTAHLAMAVQQGSVKLTLMLLCAGADPGGGPGGWAGMLALAESHPEVADLLRWWKEALQTAAEEAAAAAMETEEVGMDLPTPTGPIVLGDPTPSPACTKPGATTVAIEATAAGVPM